ncbi:MAG: diguanylate cyclase [Hyphomonadaceae bacterium]
MTYSIFLKSPIEVIAASPRLEMIKSRLRDAGLRPYEMDETLNSSDALFIDAISATPDQLKLVHRQIVRSSDRPMVLLSDGSAPSFPNVSQIFNISDIETVPALLDIAARKRHRLQEVQLRAQTAKQIAGQIVDVPDDEQLNLLFLGDGSSEFLSLISALRREDITITAALTAMTAHQYLRDHNFHGFIVDIRKTSKVGADFLKTYMPSDVAAQIPVYAIRDKANTALRDTTDQLSSITELIDVDHDMTRLALRISDLANYHASLTPLTPAKIEDYRIRDQFTPLFSATFLEQHLENQIQTVSDTPTQLSLMTLQLASRADGNMAAREAMPIIAQSLQNALRQTDCAARLDWSTIGVSLTNTSYAGGVKLAQRLILLLEDKHPEILQDCRLDWRVIERRAYHSVSDLLAIGKTGPQTRIFRAA